MQFPIREMGKADRSVSTSLLNYKEEVVGNKREIIIQTTWVPGPFLCDLEQMLWLSSIYPFVK